MSELTLPMIPMRGTAIFPSMSMHVDVAREKSKAAIEHAMLSSQQIFLISQREAAVEEPMLDDLAKVGCVCRIKQVLRIPGDTVRILAEGLYRAEIKAITADEHMFEAVINEVSDEFLYDHVQAAALMRLIMGAFEEYAQESGKISTDIMQSLKAVNDPSYFADLMTASVLENEEQRQEILDIFDPVKRLEWLYEFLLSEIQIIEMEKKISVRVKRQIDKSQKEYYLREQVKAIQKELGEGESEEAEELENRIQQSDMNENAKKKALKELERMKRMPAGMPESALIRTYLEWMLELPWANQSKDNEDLDYASEILESEHYGLEKVKERILEFLAVHTLTKGMHGPILCLVGPPGVGKTSIARSVAKALGRNFVRMSLGGVRDEAEIRGHRRTYVGALPGKIIYHMRQAGTVNPLFLLDEIDKMSSDFRGDPASAMLEVLDSEQNNSFSDHYLEVPYDLSKVMFITTANTAESIPRPLLDRMELIQLSGYTEQEKLEIAKRHLLPRQLKEHGLKEDCLTITDEALLKIISDYTREAGVRNLERRLAAVCRKAAIAVVKNKSEQILVNCDNLEQYLSDKKIHRGDANKKDAVGIVTGLAWTSVGGETLNIETAVMPGNGELVLTGHLGDVMKESAVTGMGIIRANAERWGINSDFHKKKDIHIHIPEGAMPKDGPSAGISMFSAMVSALSNIKVRCDTAMTGEITLSGNVLPIGGLKEKALAAYRAGVKRVIIPSGNAEDISDIPQEIVGEMQFIPVDDINQVLENALVKMPVKRERAGGKAVKDGN
jgi:endopeptidase La